MKAMIRIFLLMFLLLNGLLTNAQTVVKVTKNLNYRQTVTPSGVDNYLFSSYYYNGKKTYNMKSFAMSDGSLPVIDFKVNPAGASYAVLSGNAKKVLLRVLSLVNTTNDAIYTFKDLTSATAIAYTADSRYLIVADGIGNLIFYNTKGFSEEFRVTLGYSGAVTGLATSTNGYYVAAATSDGVFVVNQDRKAVRLRIPVQSRVTCMSFNDDSSLFGILTSGSLKLYDTSDFSTVTFTVDVTQATGFSFHPDGKYVTIAKNGDTMMFYNILDATDTGLLQDAQGGISSVKFVRDGKHQTYLTYTAPNMLKYRLIAGLQPNYTRRMRSELTQRMLEWCKRRPGESEAEFNQRVTEENQQKQKKLFAREISTRLANETRQQQFVQLGKYNPNTGTLALNVGGKSPVYLKVPQNEVASFSNASDLELSNVEYGLTKNDNFEIVYATVRNKLTGKEYVFDNRDQQNLDFLKTDDSFVPLAQIQTAARQEVTLQGIRQRVVDKAKQNNLISDHTQIQVKTQVVSELDAEGKRITNYQIDFGYDVEAEYSVKEDFALGKYEIKDSHAAQSMLEVMTQAFNEEFSDYIKAGKKLVITVTGSADALPINGTLDYNGSYGEFTDEPYYINGNLSTVTVTSKEGVRTNEQLAFLRAQAVRDYITKHMGSISVMNTQYITQIELSEGTGSQYRRIHVTFTFVDANIKE